MKRLIPVFTALFIILSATPASTWQANRWGGEATEVAPGAVELATDAETVTGTATDKATTPANITAKMSSPGPIGDTAPSTGAFTAGIIIPSATQVIAFDIQGDTNDYTGAGTAFGLRIARDINRGTGNSVSLAAGWQSYLNQKHTDAYLTGDREAYGAISRIDNQGAITNTTASNYQYWSNGAHNTAKMSDTAVFDTDSTGILEIAVTGTYGYAFADAGWTINDTSGGGPANTVVAAGLRSVVDDRLVLGGTAAATVINAGHYVEMVLGNTAGTSLGAGLYIPAASITGSDANYAIYSLETDPSVLTGDLTVANLAATTYASTGAVTDAELLYVGDVAGAIYYVGGTDVPLTDGGTGSSTAAGARTNLAIVTTQDVTTDADPYTLTPTNVGGKGAVRILLTVHADDVDIALAEGSATDMDTIIIHNITANTAIFSDDPAIQECKYFELEQDNTCVWEYRADRWVLVSTFVDTEYISSMVTVETEFIPVGYMIDGASAPDLIAIYTSGTEKVTARTFSTDLDEDLRFYWKVPLDIDAASGIKFEVNTIVTHATGPTNKGVSFFLAGVSAGSGDPLNGTLGTPVESKWTGLTEIQYDLIDTTYSAAVTITDLAVGENANFYLYRDVSDGDDDYDEVIGVIGITIKYKRNHNATF